MCKKLCTFLIIAFTEKALLQLCTNIAEISDLRFNLSPCSDISYHGHSVTEITHSD